MQGQTLDGVAQNLIKAFGIPKSPTNLSEIIDRSLPIPKIIFEDGIRRNKPVSSQPYASDRPKYPERVVNYE